MHVLAELYPRHTSTTRCILHVYAHVGPSVQTPFLSPSNEIQLLSQAHVHLLREALTHFSCSRHQELTLSSPLREKCAKVNMAWSPAGIQELDGMPGLHLQLGRCPGTWSTRIWIWIPDLSSRGCVTRTSSSLRVAIYETGRMMVPWKSSRED